MNQEEIKKILPHRDHMLLIDEAELREGKAYGKKTIRGDEFFLQGHFPGNPRCHSLRNSGAECVCPAFR